MGIESHCVVGREKQAVLDERTPFIRFRMGFRSVVHKSDSNGANAAMVFCSSKLHPLRFCCSSQGDLLTQISSRP